MFLCVRASGESYALPLPHVVRVLAAARVSPAPGAPDWVLGVLNLEGRALAVVHLARRFGLAERPLSPDDRLVVIRVQDQEIAVWVDEVAGILSAGPGGPAAPGEPLSRSRALSSVFAGTDGLVMALDDAVLLPPGEVIPAPEATTPDPEARP